MSTTSSMKKPPRATAWRGSDAWWRRDVGDGTYLAITRDRFDRWSWACRRLSDGEVLGTEHCQGPETGRAAADRFARARTRAERLRRERGAA